MKDRTPKKAKIWRKTKAKQHNPGEYPSLTLFYEIKFLFNIDKQNKN